MPTDAELSHWNEREDKLNGDELKRIPVNLNESRAECAICLRELHLPEDNESTKVIVAVDSVGSCGHAFHKKCLERWFDEQVRLAGALTCPSCRRPFLDQKIDMLYNRVDGQRLPAAPRPPWAAPLQDRNPIAEYVTLWEAPYGNDWWRLIVPLTVTLRSVQRLDTDYNYVLHIPNVHRIDWMHYAYHQFCVSFNLDRERFTFEVWANIMTKSQRKQTWWLSYHVLVSKLRAGQLGTPGTMFAYILGL